MKTLLIIFVVLLLSCSKEVVYCWECTTTTHTVLSWAVNRTVHLGYPIVTTNTHTICDYTAQDIALYEKSGTDSTSIEDGTMVAEFKKTIKCHKQ